MPSLAFAAANRTVELHPCGHRRVACQVSSNGCAKTVFGFTRAFQAEERGIWTRPRRSARVQRANNVSNNDFWRVIIGVDGVLGILLVERHALQVNILERMPSR